MKKKIYITSVFVALALFGLQSTNGQTQLPAPRRPTPDTGKPKPTGSVTGGLENIINSRLLIYVKNGVGTTSTNTSGEFPVQLAASATVNKEFNLQWTRTKPGKAEKGNLYITSVNSTNWMAVQSVAMPAQATAVNIPYSMPNLGPKTYELKVVGETGSSTKVILSYTGKSNGSSAVATSTETSGPTPQASKFKVIEAKFSPRIGTINEPGYHDAKLSLTLAVEADAPLKGITVEVYSEPFKNSENLTASGSKNAPITLFSGYRAFGYVIHPGLPQIITVVLHHTAKGQVNAQEAGPGIYSPGDWNIAYGQTTTASFHWSVDGGKLSGSFDQSLKKPWQWSVQ
jgi:hypothetical protein